MILCKQCSVDRFHLIIGKFTQLHMPENHAYSKRLTVSDQSISIDIGTVIFTVSALKIGFGWKLRNHLNNPTTRRQLP